MQWLADKIVCVTFLCPTGYATLQVAEKVEQSSTFCNVAKPVAMCNECTGQPAVLQYCNQGEEP